MPVGIVASAHVAGDAYSAAVLADSPVFYWRLDESSGTSAADTSGNSRPGAYVNSPTLSVSPAITSGSAVTFDGTNDHVSLTWTGLVDAAAVSFECWFKHSVNNVAYALAGIIATGGSTGLQIRANIGGDDVADNGDLSAWFRTGANDAAWAKTTAATYADGNWHHLVVTATTGAGTRPYIYVDGSDVSTGVDTGMTGTTFGTIDYPLTVGARNVRGVLGQYYNGSIDEVAFYHSALSSTRIAAHYSAGS